MIESPVFRIIRGEVRGMVWTRSYAFKTRNFIFLLIPRNGRQKIIVQRKYKATKHRDVICQVCLMKFEFALFSFSKIHLQKQTKNKHQFYMGLEETLDDFCDSQWKMLKKNIIIRSKYFASIIINDCNLLGLKDYCNLWISVDSVGRTIKQTLCQTLWFIVITAFQKEISKTKFVS